jgi:hypothetical protein
VLPCLCRVCSSRSFLFQYGFNTARRVNRAPARCRCQHRAGRSRDKPAWIRFSFAYGAKAAVVNGQPQRDLDDDRERAAIAGLSLSMMDSADKQRCHSDFGSTRAIRILLVGDPHQAIHHVVGLDAYDFRSQIFGETHILLQLPRRLGRCARPGGLLDEDGDQRGLPPLSQAPRARSHLSRPRSRPARDPSSSIRWRTGSGWPVSTMTRFTPSPSAPRCRTDVEIPTAKPQRVAGVCLLIAAELRACDYIILTGLSGENFLYNDSCPSRAPAPTA